MFLFVVGKFIIFLPLEVAKLAVDFVYYIMSSVYIRRFVCLGVRVCVGSLITWEWVG